MTGLLERAAIVAAMWAIIAIAVTLAGYRLGIQSLVGPVLGFLVVEAIRYLVATHRKLR